MTAEHPSALQLDALALAALDPIEARRIADHLAGCERCLADAEAARGEREVFQREILLRSAAAVAERIRPARWWRRRRAWLLVPAALAAAALLWLARPVAVVDRLPTGSAGGAIVAVKGAASLQVFASRDGKVFAVRDGAALRPGDRIRFVVQPAGLPHLLVASIDGAGQATVYFPPGARRSGRVDPAARAELPGSIELDDAGGPERVYALFSRAPLEAGPVLDALRAVGARGADAIRNAGDLAVGADEQVSLVVEKVAR